MYRGKDGVGIDSGTAAASVGGVVTSCGVFIGLNGRSVRQSKDGMRNAHL